MDVEESVFDPQNGGAIMDSGSSFTYLVEPAFNALLAMVSQWAGGCGQGIGTEGSHSYARERMCEVTSGVCFPGQPCCK